MGSFLYIGTGKDCLLICVKSGSGKRAGAVRTRERQESGSGKRAGAASKRKWQESRISKSLGIVLILYNGTSYYGETQRDNGVKSSWEPLSRIGKVANTAPRLDGAKRRKQNKNELNVNRCLVKG